MPNLNPVGAYQRLLDAGTNERGFCLVAVGNAILNGEPVLDGALTAHAAATDVPVANRHGGAAPKDYPIFISGAGGDWDVVISAGDGVNCAASDYSSHWGKTGVQTIASRCKQVGGTVQFWANWLLGYTLIGTSPAGGGTVITEEPMTFQIVNLADGVKDIEIMSLDTGIHVHVNTPQDVELLQRAQAGGTETFLTAERDIINSYLIQLVPPVLTDTQVAALGAQIAAGIKVTVPPFPTVPTAAENGAAARSAIVAP